MSKQLKWKFWTKIEIRSKIENVIEMLINNDERKIRMVKKMVKISSKMIK